MRYYTVIDTNVLVSALITKNDQAATVQIVNAVLAGEVIPVYSDEIMVEYREVLSRKKFKFSPELIQYLLSSIERYGLRVDPSPTGEILPDMKDLPFYEVVYEKKEDGAYLVTGNLKHFPIRPYIVTARQMMDIVLGCGREE